jgi:uncharacterized membrane protein YvbJ
VPACKCKTLGSIFSTEKKKRIRHLKNIAAGNKKDISLERKLAVSNKTMYVIFL